MKTILILFVVFTAFVYGCADSIVETTPAIDEKQNADVVKPTFSDIQNKILNKSCALSGCHVKGVQPPDLSGDAYDVIVGKPGSQGLNYIEPGKPQESYLYLKITGAAGISGNPMPLNASPLPQTSITAIKTWIENGAEKN